MDPKQFEEMETEAKERLQDFVQGFKELEGLNLKSYPISGLATDGIEQAADGENPDLIIMGTKGAGGLTEFFLGSTTSSVIHRVKTPVLVIPEKARVQEFKNILFLFDMEVLEDFGKLGGLKFLSKAFRSYVHILYVKGKYPTKHYDDLAILDSYFETVKHGISSSLFEHFQAGVNDFIKKNEIDLIAVLARERNFFEKLFHISKTDQLAFHSDLPLLVLHE